VAAVQSPGEGDQQLGCLALGRGEEAMRRGPALCLLPGALSGRITGSYSDDRRPHPCLGSAPALSRHDRGGTCTNDAPLMTAANRMVPMACGRRAEPRLVVGRAALVLACLLVVPGFVSTWLLSLAVASRSRIAPCIRRDQIHLG
jgi:hypothetical protein